MKMITTNGVLICSPYYELGKGIEGTGAAGGFKRVKQKETLYALDVLDDAAIKVGEDRIIPKGSKVYLREEILSSHPWVRKIYSREVDGQTQEYILVEFDQVVALERE